MLPRFSLSAFLTPSCREKGEKNIFRASHRDGDGKGRRRGCDFCARK